MRPISAEVSRGESHLFFGTFKVSFTPLLQLKKFPDISVYTREEARGSRPLPEEARFRVEARDEESFPCLVLKEFSAFPTHLKRRRSPQERREELQVSATIPRVTRISVHSRGTCFPCTASTFTPRIDSQHVGTWYSPGGKTRGKASWESLEGKPQIPFCRGRKA